MVARRIRAGATTLTAAMGTQQAWPGIMAEGGPPSRCLCSWAWRGGRMEVKYVSAACPVRGHRAAA